MTHKFKVGDEAHMISWIGNGMSFYEPESIRSGRIRQVRLDGKCRITWINKDGTPEPEDRWHEPEHINPDLPAARFVFRDALEKQIATAEATVTRLKERLATIPAQ